MDERFSEALYDYYSSDDTYLSTCCGARPLGELDDCGDGVKIGICRDCKDHASFDKSED